MRTIVTFANGQKVTFRGHTLKMVCDRLKAIELDQTKAKQLGNPVKLIRKPI